MTDQGETFGEALLARAIQEVEAEASLYRQLIAKGKGTWPLPGYVRNDTWIEWNAKRWAFEESLRLMTALSEKSLTEADLLRLLADLVEAPGEKP